MFSPGGNGSGSAGPLGSQQKREGNGELKERRLTDAVISSSFITLGHLRLERRGEITSQSRTCVTCVRTGPERVRGFKFARSLKLTPQAQKKGIIYIFKHCSGPDRRSLSGQEREKKHRHSSVKKHLHHLQGGPVQPGSGGGRPELKQL